MRDDILIGVRYYQSLGMVPLNIISENNGSKISIRYFTGMIRNIIMGILIMNYYFTSGPVRFFSR